MKILTLLKDVTDTDTLNKGIAQATQLASTIGLPLEFIQIKTTKQFTSVPFSNAVNANGYEVNPTEIFQEANGAGIPFDIDFLVYDWTKITPQPTNPADNGMNIQLPIQWYATFPEVFADYFLHELSHYFFAKTGKTDITHLMTDGTLQAQYPTEYNQYKNDPNQWYLYLIKGLYTPPQAPTSPVTHATVRIGSKGSDVSLLQQELGIISDGSFGKITQKAVISFQVAHGLVSDGIVGPKTWNVLLGTPTAQTIIDIITQICLANGVEPELGIAVASCESGLDKNATLFNPGSNSTDRGLFQWNSKYHSEITDAQAFDPTTATKLFCNAVKAGKLTFYWSASQHCWSQKLSPAIKKKYGILS